MKGFKDAVQKVVLVGMRRGYFRHELDRMWGKFLVNWWKAEEVRRGELRSWFRKMTQWVKKQVQKERQGYSKESQGQGSENFTGNLTEEKQAQGGRERESSIFASRRTPGAAVVGR